MAFPITLLSRSVVIIDDLNDLPPANLLSSCIFSYSFLATNWFSDFYLCYIIVVLGLLFSSKVARLFYFMKLWAHSSFNSVSKLLTDRFEPREACMFFWDRLSYFFNWYIFLACPWSWDFITSFLGIVFKDFRIISSTEVGVKAGVFKYVLLVCFSISGSTNLGATASGSFF